MKRGKEGREEVEKLRKEEKKRTKEDSAEEQDPQPPPNPLSPQPPSAANGARSPRQMGVADGRAGEATRETQPRRRPRVTPRVTLPRVSSRSSANIPFSQDAHECPGGGGLGRTLKNGCVRREKLLKQSTLAFHFRSICYL